MQRPRRRDRRDRPLARDRRRPRRRRLPGPCPRRRPLVRVPARTRRPYPDRDRQPLPARRRRVWADEHAQPAAPRRRLGRRRSTRTTSSSTRPAPSTSSTRAPAPIWRCSPCAAGARPRVAAITGFDTDTTDSTGSGTDTSFSRLLAPPPAASRGCCASGRSRSARRSRRRSPSTGAPSPRVRRARPSSSRPARSTRPRSPSPGRPSAGPLTGSRSRRGSDPASARQRGGNPCSSAPLTAASSAFKRYSASASTLAKRPPGAASGPWWQRTQCSSASRRRSSSSLPAALAQDPQPDLDVAEQAALVAGARSSRRRRTRASCRCRGRSPRRSAGRSSAAGARARAPARASRPRRCARAGRRGRRGGRRACTGRGGTARAATRRRAARRAAGGSRVGDLAREVLEEAVELVEVAVGDRQERRRVGAALAGALDPLELDLRLLAEAHDAARHAHQLAALEAPAVQVGVAEQARRQRRAAVAQLEREVGRAAAREQTLLARAREDALDPLARAQRRQRAGAVGRLP